MENTVLHEEQKTDVLQIKTLNRAQEANQKAADANAQLLFEIEEGLQTPVDDIGLFVKSIPSNRMLDLGCGTGRYVDEFLFHQLTYTGVDVSVRSLEIARRRNPGAKFSLMSYRKLFRIPTASIDGVWSCCVLNHEPKVNMQPVLAELRRVLVPGGVLSVILPCTGESNEGFGSTYPCELESYFAYWELEEFAGALTDAKFQVRMKCHRYHSGAISFLTTT